VLTICASEIPRGASWGDDGHIVFATQRQMLRVAADGGEPVELTKPDPASGERGRWHLSVLPGGHSVLFTIVPSDPAATPHIAVLDRTSGGIKRLVPGGHPEYLETGHLLFAATGRLWAVRFDTTKLDVVGDPTPVVEGIHTGTVVSRTMRYRTRARWSTSLNRQLPEIERSRGSTATGARRRSMRRLDPICLPVCHPMTLVRRWPFSIRSSGMLASSISRQ
jgi:hypothetical protein